LHDASRGVPGSWRRAVEGIDRLLGAGVGVCVVHVVTPDNADAIGELLEQMWVLGVPWVRVTAVTVTGAAARSGEWKVSTERLREAAREFGGRREGMKITVQAGTGGTIALQGLSAPGSFLVRPNGDVRPDSLRPFTFGNAIEDGLAASWVAIREGWDDERINSWAGSMRGARDMPKAELIPYLDAEAPIAGSAAAAPGGREEAVPEPTPPRPVDPAQDGAAAREMLHELALARRYRQLPLRWSGSPDQRFVRLVGDGTYLRLNGTAALVMDALDEGTVGEAIEQLDSRFDIGAERATTDVLATVRALQRSRVIVAADASHALATEPGTSDLPDLEPGA
jgi:Coenzyme PQQ synthesis protein D (PqqD)